MEMYDLSKHWKFTNNGWPPSDCSGYELGLRPLWRLLHVWKKSFKPEDWFLEQQPGSTRDDQESH